MLSNAYFLAKFRLDTAENEPAKKTQCPGLKGSTMGGATAPENYAVLVTGGRGGGGVGGTSPPNDVCSARFCSKISDEFLRNYVIGELVTRS